MRGTAALLSETGFRMPGADVLIDSDLPIGAGLSSSASLELAVAVAFATLADHPIDRAALARLGQRVENEILGVRSGITCTASDGTHIRWTPDQHRTRRKPARRRPIVGCSPTSIPPHHGRVSRVVLVRA